MQIHIVKSKTDSIFKNSTCQLLVRNKSASYISCFDSKIIVTNWSPSIPNIRYFTTTITTIKIFTSSLKWQFGYTLEPIMISQWSWLSFPQSCKIKTSSPLWFIKLSLRYKKISLIVVISRTIPILKADFILMRS